MKKAKLVQKAWAVVKIRTNTFILNSFGTPYVYGYKPTKKDHRLFPGERAVRVKITVEELV